MSKPGEHKTVQPPSSFGLRRSGARILAYAQEIGWSFVTKEEAERRRGVGMVNGEERMVKGGSLFFDHLLDAKVREFSHREALIRDSGFHPTTWGDLLRHYVRF